MSSLDVYIPLDNANTKLPIHSGLLGEAEPVTAPKLSESGGGTVLLTNDLTPAVVDEALQEGAKMIVCYRMSALRE